MTTSIHFVGGDNVVVIDEIEEVDAKLIAGAGTGARVAFTAHTKYPVLVDPAKVTYLMGTKPR